MLLIPNASHGCNEKGKKVSPCLTWEISLLARQVSVAALKIAQLFQITWATKIGERSRSVWNLQLHN